MISAGEITMQAVSIFIGECTWGDGSVLWLVYWWVTCFLTTPTHLAL